MPFAESRAREVIGSLVIGCLTVVCFPAVLCCYVAYHSNGRYHPKPKSTRRRAENPEEAPLRPLPAERERRLSDVGDMHPQLQSALVARIPTEVRLLIWENLLGRETDDDVIHLGLLNGSLAHVRCYESEPSCKLGYQHECWRAIKEPSSWRIGPNGEDTKRKLLLILLTCRLIYREAVEILYQSNTFDMRSSHSICALPRVILPQRFHQIRSIRFSTTFMYFRTLTATGAGDEVFARCIPDPPHGAPTWPAACQVLASMKNLVDAEITIMFSNRSGLDIPPQDGLITSTLKPLELVRARKYSVVVANALINRVTVLLGPRPFQLVPRVRPANLFD